MCDDVMAKRLQEHLLGAVGHTSIRGCARCEGTHLLLPVRRFGCAPSGEWTHWTTCPATGEPILMTIDEVPE